MQNKQDEGFSLIEILVSIVILAAFVVPTCSALVMSNEMNNRTDALMQAQLDVSSALEMLMARGIKEENGKPKGVTDGTAWENITEELDRIILVQGKPEYAAIVESRPESVIRESNDNDAFSVEVFWIVTPSADGTYYSVTAISKDGLVEVTTSIRKVS